MKCKNCAEIIPSKFAHSIKTNICPFCGEEIMEVALQTILAGLQALMKDAEPFMEEVEDWLNSNYSLRKGGKKISSEVLNPDDDSFDEETIKKQTEAAKSTINFQKRAGIKVNDIKSLVEKIQNGGGAAKPEEFVGIDEDYGEIDMGKEEAGKPLTQQEAMAMVQGMSQGISNTDEDPVKAYYEIEKLKKLQRSQPSGGGRFSRGD